MLRRRALPRSEQTLRTPRASRLRLQPRPARGVRFHLQKRRARARPDVATSPRRPSPNPACRGAAKRSTLLVHAVSASASRSESDAARVSARDSGKAQAHRPEARYRVTNRLRSVHSRRKTSMTAIRCSMARSTASPATGNRRCVQARHPQPRPAGPLPRGRRGASRARHADGANVRLDRRRTRSTATRLGRPHRAKWRLPDESCDGSKAARRTAAPLTERDKCFRRLQPPIRPAEFSRLPHFGERTPAARCRPHARHLSKPRRLVGPAPPPASLPRIRPGPHVLCADRRRDDTALPLLQAPRLLRRRKEYAAWRDRFCEPHTRSSLRRATLSGSRRKGGSWMYASARFG